MFCVKKTAKHWLGSSFIDQSVNKPYFFVFQCIVVAPPNKGNVLEPISISDVACRKMMINTLRDLSKAAVIKHGSGPRCHLPLNLQLELEAIDKSIKMDMTGDDYYEYYVQDSYGFHIDWHSGSWNFVLRRPLWNLHGHEMLSIRAGHNTFFAPQWAELIAMDLSPVRWYGCTINDYTINVEDRKLILFGSYNYPLSIHLSNLFQITLHFSKTGFFLRIKSEEWDPIDGEFYTNKEKCLEQPDTEEYDFFRWDNEFHRPPFFGTLFQHFR